MQVQIAPSFGTDSINYDVLTRGVHKSAVVKGATCEIGLRLAGGSKFIVDAVAEMGQSQLKPHIAIDPYGNVPYPEGDHVIQCDYTNKMRNEAMVNMYLYAQMKGFDFYFFNMKDSTFFRLFQDGFPCFINEGKEEQLCNQYSFVHLDGPHEVDTLKKEISFFHPRMESGAVIVFDDCQLYDHKVVDSAIKELGWECYETTPDTLYGQKYAYIKL